MLLGRIIVGYYGMHDVLKLGTLVDGTIFVFGPLLYCYIRRLLFQESPAFQLKWIHQLPVFLYLIYFGWTLELSFSTAMEHYRSGLLPILFFIIEGLGLISMSFYILRSFFLLKSSKYPKDDASEIQHKTRRFVKLLLMALSIFTGLWLINFINEYIFRETFQYLSYQVMWLSIGGLMYVIGLYSLIRPEIFQERQPKEKVNSSQLRLSSEEIELLQRKLKKKLEGERLYLDSKMSLVALSEAIGTSTNNLSWLLNNVYEKKFYEFVNEYRVKAFLELIQQDKHKTNTLYALARDVGFNSKSTFNKAFKTITNQTPTGYIKQLSQ
jgi:AraC-like DNA-binding protein